MDDTDDGTGLPSPRGTFVDRRTGFERRDPRDRRGPDRRTDGDRRGTGRAEISVDPKGESDAEDGVRLYAFRSFRDRRVRAERRTGGDRRGCFDRRAEGPPDPRLDLTADELAVLLLPDEEDGEDGGAPGGGA